MKIASFHSGGRFGFGCVEGGVIVPTRGYAAATGELEDHLDMWTSSTGAPLSKWDSLPLSSVVLLPPVPRPLKVFCVANNFYEASENQKPTPRYPLLFTRFADSLVGFGEALLKPACSANYDFEGELAVIIGRSGFRVREEDAMSHVAGYACFNDGSVRDWQKHTSQFTPGKNFHRSGSFGPWLVTPDEVGDLASLSLETTVNGVVKQRIGLDKFIFSVSWLIAYVSNFTPIAPSDVIATGTPSGFGSNRSPAEFLRAGDIVEVEISKVGTLGTQWLKGNFEIRIYFENICVSESSRL